MAPDFSGGTVDKSLPANAGDLGSIPGLGRFHMHGADTPTLHNSWACILELQSCNSWALVLQLLKSTHLKPVPHDKRSHQNEKLQQRVAPFASARKPMPSTIKNK